MQQFKNVIYGSSYEKHFGRNRVLVPTNGGGVIGESEILKFKKFS